MRTADEIIQTIGDLNYAAMQEKYRDRPTLSINEAWKMIDEARKEVVNECARRAEVEMQPNYDDENTESAIINEQSILSLIKELK